MTTRIILTYDPPPIPIRNFDFRACFDDYDGAPDAGHQCMGDGATAVQALCEIYDDYESWFDEPLIAHRPMVKEDL
jgi:hypothetical protein